MQRYINQYYLLRPLGYLCMSACLVMPAYATSSGWLVDISGGFSMTQPGKQQTFNLTNTIQKSYTANKKLRGPVAGSIFIGKSIEFSHHKSLQLGMSIAGSSNTKIAGLILDDANPAFDNHSYQYRIQHTMVSLRSKLLFSRGQHLSPWFAANVGIAFNRAYNFRNTPLIPTALANNNFTNHTTTTFGYALSAGLQTQMNKHCSLGIGYQIADWGRSRLARAAGQTRNTGPKLSHLYTQSLLFNLSYTRAT